MRPEDLLWASTLTLATIAVLAVCHESAHILAGRLVGFRLRAVRVGYWRFQARRPVERVPRPMASLAAVELAPVTPRHLRPRHALMVAAGPVADFLVCGSLLSAAVAFSAAPFEFSILAAAVGAGLVSLADLIPMRRRGLQSDARWLLEWLLRPNATRSLVAVSLLHRLCLDGLQPKEMPEEWLRLALAAPDSSPRSRLAKAYAFGAAVGRGRIADAEQHLLGMLSASDPRSEPAGHAQLLAAAAFFAARYQLDPGRGRELLSQAARFQSLPLHVTSGVEAAISLAAGDAQAAAAAAEGSLATMTVRVGSPAGWEAADRAELQELLDEARVRLVSLAS